MNRSQALAAIRAANIKAKLVRATDETTDDEIQLIGNPDISVQICATRDGLRFIASFADGEGDDWGVTQGKMTRDPVAAAREAIGLALA
jgi:hypothetical protein